MLFFIQIVLRIRVHQTVNDQQWLARTVVLYSNSALVQVQQIGNEYQWSARTVILHPNSAPDPSPATRRRINRD